MATFGILLRPFRRKSADSKPHFHAAATLLSLIPRPPPPSAISPDPSAAVLRSTSFGSRLFSPLRRIPFSGPLFLSSPPWKLSQAATPLYFQNGEARFPRKGRFPLQLGFRASKNVRAGLTDAVRWVKPSVLVADEIRREERLFNLPNSISIGRLLSGPVIAWMIIKEWYVPAFMILGISGMTDWLDGYVARKMRIHSVIGSYLDPLADKVLIGCVALAMVKQDLLHGELVALIVFRDVGLVGGAIFKRASIIGWEWKSLADLASLDKIQPEKVEPLFISKVNTVLQLGLVAGALLQPEFGSEQTQLYINYLSWLVASTTVASSMGYGAKLLWPRK